jgi:hypothetical protein
MVLAPLEVNELVANAFLDKDTSCMLLHNGFFVLRDMNCQYLQLILR